MLIKPPPIQSPINGLLQGVWVLWLSSIVKRLNDPTQLNSYTVANVPTAANYEGCVVYISNEAGGKTLAFSDGTNWRRTQDRNIIS